MSMLAIGLSAFTGSALAGNGNGNGSSQASPATQSVPPQPASPAQGNSENAPGQQKKDPAPASQQPVPATAPSHGSSPNAPGQAKKTSTPAPAQQAQQQTPSNTSSHGKSAGSQGQAKKDSSPSATTSITKAGPATNGSGKPRKIPAPVAATAPANSWSGPGNSGLHKVTVCHNGHAITIDAHGAMTHHFKHGDPYLPAGTKGKVSGCESSATAKPSSSLQQTSTCSSVTTTSTTVTPQKGHAYGRLKHGRPLNTQTKTDSSTVPTGAACGNSTVQTQCGSALVTKTQQQSTDAKEERGHAYGEDKRGEDQSKSAIEQIVTAFPNGQRCSSSTPTSGTLSSGTLSAGTSVSGAPLAGTSSNGTRAAGGALAGGSTKQAGGGVGGATATVSKGSTPGGGVLGATAARSGSKAGGTGSAGGVLGALATVGHGTLPFTGFPIWVAVLIALALIALGLTIRRRGRATV